MKKLRKLTHAYHTLIIYFLSYFLILSFLLLSFFFIIQNELSKLYLTELNRQAQQQLESITEHLGNGLTTISQVNIALSTDINLILSRNTNDNWIRYSAFRTINNYSVGNSLIDSIVYYDKEHDAVISSGKYVKREDNGFRIYNVEKSIILSLDDYENVYYNRLIHVADQSSEYMIYYPWVDENAKYTVFYILNQLELENILNNAAGGEITSIVLLNRDKEISAGINSGLLQPYLEAFEVSEGTYQLDSQTSVLVGSALPGGYAVAALISNDILMKQVNTAFQRTYLILILIGILGLILVFFAMNRTYLPLHKLTQKIVEKPRSGQGYLEQLDQAFTSALAENQLLQDKIDKYRFSMQKSILDSVITDSRSSAAEAFRNIDPFFTMDPDNHIFAIKMKSASRFPAEEVAAFLKDALPKQDTCIILESHENSAVFLLSYSGPEQNKEEVIFMLISDLHEEKGYFAALSNSSCSPLDIPSLYENAMLASSFWKESAVVAFDACAPRLNAASTLSYPYQRLDELAAALKNHHLEEARTLIRTLFELIDHSLDGNPLPDFFVRCVLIDILTAIINSMNQANIKFKSYSDLYFETLYFCRSCSYEEKKSDIEANAEQLLLLFEEQIANKIINAPQIEQLVEKQYTSPDFSITILADSFHVSIAYMSFLFKKEMGQNFSDYLWEKRLEKAKQLLLTTDTGIDDISIAVGYLNTSSFRRKFKQATGITPSQFRSRKYPPRVVKNRHPCCPVRCPAADCTHPGFSLLRARLNANKHRPAQSLRCL